MMDDSVGMTEVTTQEDSVSTTDPYLGIMKQVSQGGVPTNMSGDAVKTQIQSFMLAQAQKELLRVVKYTEFLDKVEDEYKKRVEENLSDLSFDELPEIMNVIYTSLDRAQGILSSVIKDEKLGVFISNTFNNINTPTSSDPITPDSGLALNAASRDAVRKAVSSLLGMLSNEVEADYIIDPKGDKS